jgi:thiazole synthase
MLQVADKTFSSRLFLGTAQYPSLEVMQQSIIASQAEVITVAIRRQSPEKKSGKAFWDYIKQLSCHLLPNTAGCRTAEEAVTTAEMAREIFETNWIKLEVIGDDYNLQPDSLQLIEAAAELIQRGFEVFPYCTDDLVVCKRLVEVGCRILMPWAAPIGTGKGLLNPYALSVLRQRFPQEILIVDAGIGKPSQAAQAMEMGFDGVLLNTAVSLANNPVLMAQAFRDAVNAGHAAHQAGLMAERNMAYPSTSLLDTPFWLQENV